MLYLNYWLLVLKKTNKETNGRVFGSYISEELLRVLYLYF